MIYRYELYIMGNTANIYVISLLVIDDNQTYHADHFEMYKNIGRLFSIQVTNIVL